MLTSFYGLHLLHHHQDKQSLLSEDRGFKDIFRRVLSEIGHSDVEPNEMHEKYTVPKIVRVITA